MALDIVRLLELTSWRAFDVTGTGRVLAGSDESGSTQLVELADGASTRLTALSGAVTGRYLPGERAVVVQHDTDGDERGQLSLLRLDQPRPGPVRLPELYPLVRDPEHVHRLLDVLPGRIVYSTNRRNGVDFDVIVREVATGEEHVVYDQGGMVLEVAADGDRTALTVPGGPPMSDQLVMVEAGRVRTLTGREVAARHTDIHWLPDGSGLITTTNFERDRTGVARIDPDTGTRTWLVTSDEHDLTGWPSPDGSTLLVQANDDGAGRLALHDAATGERRHEVHLPADGWCAFPLPQPVWSPDSRFVALTFTAPAIPGDVLLVDATTGECRALTDSAAQLAGELPVQPTTHRVPTRDGERLPCFRYSPAEPDPQLAGSAVLIVHGGPESQSVRGFNPIVQALVAQGHEVLVPNVRGSTGYGKRWYSADDGRNRLEAVADLADLHDWLPAIGLDPRRAALWGGSYGGYMVLAGLAFQPKRWAAGVDIVGISSLVTFLQNTAPYRRAHREREYGSLATDADFLHEASPLTEVAAIAAPLFVLHGANDPRVPLSEAEQIAAAVRAKGLECELLVYPDEGHGLAKRPNRLDAYPKALAFLARHLTRP
ncbi:Dipeptidyl aminopeptidase/acylaminoacyl peptidase [Saccharopolyspora antimicrobica]|uniref:Dipeptidyl aminopeptidase/acylaminoacyl peptidase n=1 Tax=Saccharopolyspora antimicrobica TaxID=455193 RepID=A0A1I5IRF1_9PSEU|nr:S9 family peptidase [Saccharopolyspora antimicrobica]RKT84127.1 dipeptidyl aminopeptidase/acylaminoacyl peptidase [Saccharopolyspora antimicrobica]SFO62993.1 Dipeptidyl aminopeptidase/acylaminoacyl peptidase [Saccharopolyspora antimicrobica]